MATGSIARKQQIQGNALKNLMKMCAHKDNTKPVSTQYGNHRVMGLPMLCTLLLLWSVGLLAQTDVSDQSVESGALSLSLPSGLQMAMSLATPELRNEALLDIASAQSVLVFAKQNDAADSAMLAQKFLDDRGWLARLVERYGWINPHNAVLDPAAWLVQSELRQHSLPAMSLASPDGTPQAVLVYQVFHRADERLAVANLPVLLLRLESNAITIWEQFLQLTYIQPDSETETSAKWKEVETWWFTGRIFPSVNEKSTYGDTTDTLQLLSQLVSSAVEIRPPDPVKLQQLRYSLLANLPPGPIAQAEIPSQDLLYLASIIDGLHEGRYLAFMQGLLGITTSLVDRTATLAEIPLLASWMIAELPAISAHYVSAFAAVDPNLNAAMVAVYKVLQTIAKPSPEHGKAPRTLLADAVAQLTLLIPDMGYYFNTPVRVRIVEEINICTSIAASLGDQGYPAMERSQYDACIENLLQLADQETRLPELSGNFNGPFRPDSLRRELDVTPEQRINYGIGFLHNRYSKDCPRPATALPNPLEWAVLATTMAWFAESSPEMFMHEENESRLARMRNIGRQLMRGLAEQAGCFSGTGNHDPVSLSMAEYEAALRAFNAGVAKAEAVFRAEKLSPGADVSLALDAGQPTSYRPDDLMIYPCNPQQVCEMTAGLSTTRALIGLFPEEYLLADQSGLGKIEICYRNMEWVERRSELVRPDDENVANYFAHLGFDLVGRYVENDQVQDLFGFRFNSPDEHHYLFAQASEEVLRDSCPVEWVGTQIITPLREDRGIVPNRLTYLAASRTLPSRLIQGNWERGAEWRDWFVTGIGVTALEVSEVPDISIRLNQHLQALYQAEQTEIYQRILFPDALNADGDDASLQDEMSQVSLTKAMLQLQMMLFYPDSMLKSDAIRMAIAGETGLLERRAVSRFREDNVILTSVDRIALERLRALQRSWSEQPLAVRQQGSLTASMAYAMTRLNVLYRQFFVTRSEPIEESADVAQDEFEPPG
jgi:hypothetical protein